MRHTQRWLEQGAIALRRLTVAATWSAQILLYPVYAVFQTARLVGAQARSVLALETPDWLKRPVEAPRSFSEPPTCDTSLQQALQAVQNFARLEPVSEVAGAIGAGIAAPSQPAAALQVRPNCVRGLATQLDTRSLVLVTTENQILDMLTIAQQAILRQQIIAGTASYRRYVRSRARSPLLEQSRSLVRASQTTFYTAQSAARSLLYACLYSLWIVFETARRSGVQLQHSDVVPEAALLELEAVDRSVSALKLTTSTPIQQALQLMQQLGVISETGAVAAELTIAAASGLSKERTTGRSRTGLAPRDGLGVRSGARIRGIASCLTTRSLVLVTLENQVLDILTAHQQAMLRQRITWDVAHYGRYRRLRSAIQHSFARLHPPAREERLLLPVRAFRRLMAWMQTSPVAIATNLFQESALVAVQSVVAFTTIAAPTLQLANATAGEFGVLGAVPGRVPVRMPGRPPVRPIAVQSAEVPLTLRSPTGVPVRSPDYIEIHATLLGYVQTPVERLLRWCDRLLVWLEAIVAQVWNWFHRIFS